MRLLVVAPIVAAALAAAWLSYHLRQERLEGLVFMARQLGLAFSRQDVERCVDLPFSLFQRGDGRGAENVLSGTWQDLPVREFDYWYFDESSDTKGSTHRSYYRFSCAVTEIAAACSPLVLDREDVFTRLADHVGMHDIEFESEAFNRAFNVRAKDRRFASDLLDARMLSWLLTVDGAFRFETCGPWLLCYSKRRAPTELVALLGTLKGFRDHIPRVVHQLYGVETSR